MADDSDKPATKADISLLRAELAAKIELERLDKKIDRVAVEVVKIGARIDGLQESLDDRLSRHTDRIMTAIDAFAKKVEADNRAVRFCTATCSSSITTSWEITQSA